MHKQVHLLIYVLPLCFKFQYVLHARFNRHSYLSDCTRHDMLYVIFILAGVLATFKPYPTLSDPGLFLSMISLFPETYPC